MGRRTAATTMSELLWDATAIRLGDIPTLGKLLELADAKLLLREIVDVATDGPRLCGTADGIDLEGVRTLYAQTLKRIRKVKPVSAPDAQGEVVLFPQYAYQVFPDRGIIAPRLRAAAICAGDFSQTCMELRDGSCTGPHAGAHSFVATAGEAFHWAPWEEVLGYRVWLAGNFSRRDRYRVLADVVWFMTLFGVDSAAHDQAVSADQAEIDQATDEVFSGLTRDWSDYPSTHFCQPSACNLGLEASTDDYEAEYEAGFRSQAAILKAVADKDLADRIEHLAQMLEPSPRI